MARLEELTPDTVVRGVLDVTAERKRWAQEALSYNALVVAWPDMAARAQASAAPAQAGLFA